MLKFNQHHVTDGQTKARVSYSLDNHVSRKPTVTIYAQDYDGALGKLIPDAYVNNTDSMSDYFDKGHVTLHEGHPHYASARERAESVAVAQQVRAAERLERRLNPKPADPSTVTITSTTDRVYAHGPVRYLEIVSGGQRVSVSVGLGQRQSCHVLVHNAMQRAYRGLGKSYPSIANAMRNYRAPKVLAALEAVERSVRETPVNPNAERVAC